jgi:hypothetical protein
MTMAIEEGADHLGEGQVRQRRPHQHGARNGPVEYQRLAIEQREDDADEAVDEEGGEEPGGEIGFAQAAARADREHDGDRPRRREQEGDHRIAGIDRAEIQPGPARQRQDRLFQGHAAAS